MCRSAVGAYGCPGTLTRTDNRRGSIAVAVRQGAASDAVPIDDIGEVRRLDLN